MIEKFVIDVTEVTPRDQAVEVMTKKMNFIIDTGTTTNTIFSQLFIYNAFENTSVCLQKPQS